MTSDKPKAAFSEREFEMLAAALDGLPDARHSVFLAKLAILLAAHIGDADVLADAIGRASKKLETETNDD